MSKIQCYVLIPMRPDLNPALAERAFHLYRRSIEACPDLELTLVVDPRREPKYETDNMPWSRVARCRHKLMQLLNLAYHDFVIWQDADVVDFDPDLFQFLVHGASVYANNGVCAPTVLIEGTNTFYDSSAFIYKGQENVQLDERLPIEGRNINCSPPYYRPEDAVSWAEDARTPNAYAMAGVGTIYAMHRDILTSQPAAGFSEHSPFTDHWPLCQRAWEMNRKVVALPNIIAYHADLSPGKYIGEGWH